jgi:hypothetical protein
LFGKLPPSRILRRSVRAAGGGETLSRLPSQVGVKLVACVANRLTDFRAMKLPSLSSVAQNVRLDAEQGGGCRLGNERVRVVVGWLGSVR